MDFTCNVVLYFHSAFIYPTAVATALDIHYCLDFGMTAWLAMRTGPSFTKWT